MNDDYLVPDVRDLDDVGERFVVLSVVPGVIDASSLGSREVVTRGMNMK